MKRKQGNEASNINHIRKEFERRLLVLRYSPNTIRGYLAYFGWLQEFLEGYGEKNYSKELGERFLAEFTLQTPSKPKRSRMFRKARKPLNLDPVTLSFEKSLSKEQ